MHRKHPRNALDRVHATKIEAQCLWRKHQATKHDRRRHRGHQQHHEQRDQRQQRPAEKAMKAVQHQDHIERHLAFENEGLADQAIHPFRHPATQHPQGSDTSHRPEEGRQLARLRNLPFLTGLFKSSR
ncbi:hypothetical protein SDC9_161348 [bioreactor metagenome]|uniref:Uncharacterized protein n=1 Tax=bioreactor metagenome TaxID=1076179 RepID=A0A645FKD5_9ZZZZ